MKKTLLLSLLLIIFFISNVDGNIKSKQTQCSETSLVFITDPVLPFAYQGDRYLVKIDIMGGCPGFTYSYDGLLPEGLILDPENGILSGTIEKDNRNKGNFFFIVKVTDQNNKNYQQSYSIEIFEELTFVSTSPLKSAMIGYSVFEQLELKGGERPYTFEIISGNLPEGISLSKTGAMIGTPGKFGANYFQIRVTDGNDRLLEQGFEINIVEKLVIETERLFDAVVGEVYNFRLQANGGAYGAYQWEMRSITPRGMSLDRDSGVFSGIPRERQTILMSFMVKDIDEHSSTRDLMFYIANPLQIISLELPAGIKGQEYSESIMINGGIEPYKFTGSSDLPKNLFIELNTGIIKGIPIVSGVTEFEVWVEDSSFPSTLKDVEILSISINDSFEFITNKLLPDAMQNIPIEKIDNYSISVTGGLAPYTCEIIEGTLPEGVTFLCGQSIGLYGTPHESGDFTFTLQMMDKNNSVAQKTFYLHVIENMRIITNILVDASINQPFYQILKVEGGMPPYTWYLSEGGLPNGLELVSQDGYWAISGIPTEEIYNQRVAFMVVDSFHKFPSVNDKEYTFSVRGLGPTIVTKKLPEVKVGMSYQARIEVSGSPPFNWVHFDKNQFPEGLTIYYNNDSSITIKGKPEKAGVFPISLKVTDLSFESDSKTLTIVVHDVISILTKNLNEAYKETEYYQTIDIKNIDNSVTCQLTSGALPEGIQLDPKSCVIFGHPTVSAKSQSFCIMAKKPGEFGSSAERCYVIYIIEDETIVIQPGFFPDRNQFESFYWQLNASGGLKPYQWYITSGSLPEGITCDVYNNDFLCQGTPTQCGDFNFAAKVIDSSMATKDASKAFQFKVICEKDDLDTNLPMPPGFLYTVPDLDKLSSGKITVFLNPGYDDESGINGYSYEWNSEATTIVDNTVETIDTKIVSPLLPDGDHYYLHVASVDNAGNVSDSVHIGPFNVAHAKGQVLIVSAADPNNSIWETSKMMTEKVYHYFRVMGFTDDQIKLHIQSQLFFVDDDDIPDDLIDDNTLTPHEIITDIKIAEHHVNENNPFILFLQAIDTENSMFKLPAPDEYISGSEIDAALDWLQSATNCQISVIVESCFSGNFIHELAGTNRTIITSTGNNSYSFDRRGDISFSRILFGKLLESKTLKESFEFARISLFHLGFPEPQMDDNGDGIFNHLDAAINGNSNTILTGIGYDAIKPEFIVLSVTEGLVPFTYEADVTLSFSEIDIQDVFVQVLPPVMTNLCGIHDFPVFELNPVSINERYRCVIPNIIQSGTYKLIFNARDKLGNISDPKIYPLIVKQNPVKGDINGDQQLTLQDAIIGLQITSGVAIEAKFYKNSSLNQQKLSIGLPEVMYVILKISQN